MCLWWISGDSYFNPFGITELLVLQKDNENQRQRELNLSKILKQHTKCAFLLSDIFFAIILKILTFYDIFFENCGLYWHEIKI